jgi:hypothetical protein
MTKKESVLNIFLALVCVCAVAFSLAFPAKAAEAVREALSLCVFRVVPGVFLFMVASKILAGLGAGALLSRITGGFFERLFGVSPGGAAVIFLGLLSGYPSGAMAAGALIKSGELDLREAERVLPFATAASPAFLLGTVGSVLGERFGKIMLASQLRSARLMLLLCRARKKAPRRELESAKPERKSPLALFASAIKESGAAALNICSYVTFFFVFSSMLFNFLPSYSGAGYFGTLVSGLLEISCGFTRLGACKNSAVQYFLGGLILGFSGLSVLFQSADALGGARVSMKKYLISKISQGIVCGAIAALFGLASEKYFAKSAIFLFGPEQQKITAIWQTLLLFALNFLILGLISNFFAKIFALFKKIFKKLWKKRNL